MRSAVLLVLFASLLPLTAQADEPHAEPVDAARAWLKERVGNCMPPGGCARVLAEVYLMERPGGLREEVARKAFLGSLNAAKGGLMIAAERGDAEARRRIFKIYRENWNVLGRGYDSNLADKCVEALIGNEPLVRIEAANLIATYPVPGTAHAAIDASIENPELTRAAVVAVGLARENHAARWIVSQLTHDDPDVRQSARFTIFALGRAGVAPLKEAISGDDPTLRDAAIEALFPLANPDDVPLLYEWVRDHGDDSPALRDRVLRVIAELESGLYDPEIPKPLPWTIIETSEARGSE